MRLRGKSKPPSAALFHNNHDGTFTDVTAKAGVANERWGIGAVSADYDNDGFPDIFVSNYGKSRLYHTQPQRHLYRRCGEGRCNVRRLGDRCDLGRLRRRWQAGPVRSRLCALRPTRPDEAAEQREHRILLVSRRADHVRSTRG